MAGGGGRGGWKGGRGGLQVGKAGGVAPDKQIQLALFLASEESNHISGTLISVNDDWKKLRDSNLNPEIYTLRRVQKVEGRAKASTGPAASRAFRQWPGIPSPSSLSTRRFCIPGELPTTTAGWDHPVCR